MPSFWSTQQILFFHLQQCTAFHILYQRNVKRIEISASNQKQVLNHLNMSNIHGPKLWKKLESVTRLKLTPPLFAEVTSLTCASHWNVDKYFLVLINAFLLECSPEFYSSEVTALLLGLQALPSFQGKQFHLWKTSC